MCRHLKIYAAYENSCTIIFWTNLKGTAIMFTKGITCFNLSQLIQNILRYISAVFYFETAGKIALQRWVVYLNSNICTRIKYASAWLFIREIKYRQTNNFQYILLNVCGNVAHSHTLHPNPSVTIYNMLSILSTHVQLATYAAIGVIICRYKVLNQLHSIAVPGNPSVGRDQFQIISE